jgi:FkbM family methyltransferase
MAIPFLVIFYASKLVWGSFVSVLLFTLLALQLINWGNKEYLLRQFSHHPAKMEMAFSENTLGRLPLLVLCWIVALFLFPLQYGIWIFLWLLGRYLTHSVEALLVYHKNFRASITIETLCFGLFVMGFYLLKTAVNAYALLIVYSLSQFAKGILYFLLFRRFFSGQKFHLTFKDYKASFSFFLLSVLGFLSSKIDVYIIEAFGNKTMTAEYQITNSLLVFVMSITAFIYTPFTKIFYRTTTDVIKKSKKTLALLGLIIVPLSLLFIGALLNFLAQMSFGFLFYVIAFFYVYPSYLYGLDIVTLFKKHQEKKVFYYLLIGVIINALLSTGFLSLGYGITGALAGSALAQLLTLILFKKTSLVSRFKKTSSPKNFYAQFITPGDLCFDIGANSGNKSRLFLALGAKVIAFEPQTSCHKSLEKLKKEYSLFDFYPLAVGAENEEKELFLANHSEVATLSQAFVNYFSGEEIQWNAKETVTVKKLDSLIDTFGLPNYCKIDVEGYEFDIISHLKSKIPIVEFEFTGGFIAETIKIISLLEHENTRFNYILNEHLKLQLNDWCTAEEMKNIIQRLPIERLHGNIFVKSYATT